MREAPLVGYKIVSVDSDGSLHSSAANSGQDRLATIDKIYAHILQLGKPDPFMVERQIIRGCSDYCSTGIRRTYAVGVWTKRQANCGPLILFSEGCFSDALDAATSLQQSWPTQVYKVLYYPSPETGLYSPLGSDGRFDRIYQRRYGLSSSNSPITRKIRDGIFVFARSIKLVERV